MGNEIVVTRSEGSLSLNPGAVSLEGLTPEQQNELRMMAAKKGLELAADLHSAQVRMQASTAEVDVATNTIAGLASNKGSFSARFTGKTATGEYEIKAKKGMFFN